METLEIPEARTTRECTRQSPFSASDDTKRDWLVRHGVPDAAGWSGKDLDDAGALVKAEIASFTGRKYNSSVRSLAVCGFPARHVANLPRVIVEAHTAWMRAYEMLVAKAKSGDGYMVVLLGGRGVGKTQLATAVAGRCAVAMTTHYTKAADLFRDIRSTYASGSKTSEREVFERFATVDLLVIDEAHQRGETVAENNTLTQILDSRYDDRLDTILIANQTREEFSKSVGPSVSSRIQETGMAIECDWPSFRRPGQWMAE